MDDTRKTTGYRYTVVSSYDFMDFIAEVDQMVKDGWECDGGIAVTTNADKERSYFQALTKGDE